MKKRNMYLAIVGTPLRGAALAGFGGRYLGGEGAARLTTGLVARTLRRSLLARKEVALDGSTVHRSLAPWRVVGSLSLQWSFLFDTLTTTRLVVVTGVSSLVHLYSTSYREGDPHRARFRSYLSLFTFFLLVLVTAGSFVQRFVGWEGVGLCSYLLISFWYTRLQANKAAIKARLVNRVGDFGLRLGRLAVYRHFGSLDYGVVFARAPTAVGETQGFRWRSVDALTLRGLLLFVGAVGKSAQLGLHTWLPDAREGPTPVSALIHAATRVTAGVFLLGRCSPLREYTPTTLRVITVRGAATALVAATTGLRQNDLKRVIAYSTCSQLGYRVFAAGLSAYSVAIFHLANHARFKALLFLSAGSVIHARADEQDRRRRGGLVRLRPLTYGALRIGSVALRGFPFLAGFYSKDIILEAAFASYGAAGHFAFVRGSAAAFCTAFYSRRLLCLTFLSDPNGHRRVREGVHESPWRRAIPLRILAVRSVLIGWGTRDGRIGVGSSRWSGAVFTHPANLLRIEGEFLPTFWKLFPLCLALLGGGLAYRLYRNGADKLVAAKRSPVGKARYSFLNRKWLYDKVINDVVSQGARHVGYHWTYKEVDRGRIELLGPHGLSGFLARRSAAIGERHSGHLYHYGLRRLRGTILLGSSAATVVITPGDVRIRLIIGLTLAWRVTAQQREKV